MSLSFLCRMGFHRPTCWQDTVSQSRPPLWDYRVRHCRQCGSQQSAHRSVQPPFRMLSQDWQRKVGDTMTELCPVDPR